MAVLLFAAPVFSAPADDLFMGKVNIRNYAKLDPQAKKELVSMAAKIKKASPLGAVKVSGVVPSAESQDEYLANAAFIARNVVNYLRTLLSDKYQIFITASKYIAEKSTAQSSVEIYLYPHELKAEASGFISSQVTTTELPPVSNPVQESPDFAIIQPNADSGLLTPPPPEEEYAEVTSKKERQKVDPENATLANELVFRAKARAAEKAKLLEQQQ